MIVNTFVKVYRSIRSLLWVIIQWDDINKAIKICYQNVFVLRKVLDKQCNSNIT